MNKVKVVLIAIMLVSFSGVAMAQKSGYISLQDVVSIMPETAKLDSILQKYQTDSINTQLSVLLQDYKYRDSILRSPDTLKMPASVKAQHVQALQQDQSDLENWRELSQEVLSNKRQQLLEPIVSKARAAINAVAKEKGYAFVYEASALLMAPPGDDLLPAVAARLKIKLPPNVPLGIRQ